MDNRKIITLYKEGRDGSFRNFKCDECQSQMKVFGVMTSEACYRPFIDNLGEHIHDRNYSIATLVCENKHTQTVPFHHICPNPKCNWVQSS